MTEFLTALSGAAIPIILAWLLYFRKHKADAVGAEKNNDRTEIENYKLIATEWRETSQVWKDMADEYQMKFREQNRKFEEFLLKAEGTNKELEANRREIAKLKELLAKANKRIGELEKFEKLVKAQTQQHGNQ